MEELSLRRGGEGRGGEGRGGEGRGGEGGLVESEGDQSSIQLQLGQTKVFGVLV